MGWFFFFFFFCVFLLYQHIQFETLFVYQHIQFKTSSFLYQHIQFKTTFVFVFVPAHSIQISFLYQHTQFKTSASDFDFQAAEETLCFKLFTALNCGGGLAEGRVERRRLK